MGSGGGGGGIQPCKQHCMKRRNKTEYLIFILLCSL